LPVKSVRAIAKVQRTSVAQVNEAIDRVLAEFAAQKKDEPPTH
jgi:hypothetical protein